MNRRYLPNWLYTALPYVYLGVGALTMMTLKNQMAMLSGLTLITAASTIGFLRLRARPKTRRTRKAAHPVVNSRVVEMSWNASYETGHRVIDEQRRRLFGLCNELVDAVLTKKAKSDVELMLHDLFDHIAAHFASEEKLLAEIGHPLSKAHKDIHGALLAKAGSLRNRYRSGEIVINDLIGFVTYDIVTNHVIEESKNIELECEHPIFLTAWTDTEQKRRENADTVLKMVRADPAAGDKAYLSIATLDHLTPGKALFNCYPQVWQRVCVFAPEPKHLEKYLSSLLGQDGNEGPTAFSMQALREIGDIYTQNLHFLPASVAS